MAAKCEPVEAWLAVEVLTAPAERPSALVGDQNVTVRQQFGAIRIVQLARA
jgi:hypothetical protein